MLSAFLKYSEELVDQIYILYNGFGGGGLRHIVTVFQNHNKTVKAPQGYHIKLKLKWIQCFLPIESYRVCRGRNLKMCLHLLLLWRISKSTYDVSNLTGLALFPVTQLIATAQIGVSVPPLK